MMSDGSGACANSNDVPPSNEYASPGSCTTPFMNINRSDLRSNNEFSSFSKLSKFALYINGNLVLYPSCKSLIESMKSN